MSLTVVFQLLDCDYSIKSWFFTAYGLLSSFPLSLCYSGLRSKASFIFPHGVLSSDLSLWVPFLAKTNKQAGKLPCLRYSLISTSFGFSVLHPCHMDPQLGAGVEIGKVWFYVKLTRISLFSQVIEDPRCYPATHTYRVCRNSRKGLVAARRTMSRPLTQVYESTRSQVAPVQRPP